MVLLILDEVAAKELTIIAKAILPLVTSAAQRSSVAATGENEGTTVEQQGELAQRFEEHRSHLRAVAYRMLGSLTEADDAVQEAWIRLSRTDTDDVDNLGGWLTTVVARVSA